MEIEKRRLVSLEDFESIRENVAFHFTSQNNIESILNEGLRPLIGDNASGGLGQSAIEKTYISYGLEGVLQLYNRLITASFQQRIGDFKGISHKPFVPDSAKSKSPEESLSLIEGFEMIRQYMEDNVYFMFDAPKTQYQHSINREDLEVINKSIKDLEDSDGRKIVEKIKELRDAIEELSLPNAQGNDEQGKKEKIIRLVNERNRLSLLIREKTLPMIDDERGSRQLSEEQENPIIDEIDYNDERQRWVNQIELPHNTHTRIIEKDGKLQGVRITEERLRLFSQDGKKPSNGLDFLETMLNQVNPNDRIYLNVPICHDCNLLFKFLEYAQLVKKYKSNGLLVTKPEETIEIGGKTRTLPERQVMDLTDIGKYPELAEFIKGLEEYYEEHRYKISTEKIGKECQDKMKNSEEKKEVGDEMSRNAQIFKNAKEK